MFEIIIEDYESIISRNKRETEYIGNIGSSGDGWLDRD